MDTGHLLRWLTPAEATLYAKVGKTKLYQLMASGALRPRKLGRRTLLDREQIDALIEGGTAPTPGGTP